MALKQLYPDKIKATKAQDDRSNQEDYRVTKPPIFIFPGILGNDGEVKSLATFLHEISDDKERLIVAHRAETVLDVENTEVVSLNSEIPKFTNEAKNIVSKSFPLILIGYSYGCTQAVLAGLQLKNEGYDPHIVLIDGVAPDLSKPYYQRRSTNALDDVVKILNYAATSASLKEISISPHQYASLKESSLEEQFTQVKKMILNHNKSADQDLRDIFINYYNTAKARLKVLIFQQYPAPTSKLDTMNLLILNNTMNKYQTQTGGWDKYCNNLNVINATAIQKKYEKLANNKDYLNFFDREHTEILKENNCPPLGTIINDILEEEIDVNDLIYKAVTFYLHMFVKSNKGYEPAILEAASNYASGNTSPEKTPISSMDHSETSSENEYDDMPIAAVTKSEDASKNSSPQRTPRTKHLESAVSKYTLFSHHDETLPIATDKKAHINEQFTNKGP